MYWCFTCCRRFCVMMGGSHRCRALEGAESVGRAPWGPTPGTPRSTPARSIGLGPSVVSLEQAAKSLPAPGNVALPLGLGRVRFPEPVRSTTDVDGEACTAPGQAREPVIDREDPVAPDRIRMPAVGRLQPYGSMDPDPAVLRVEEILEDDVPDRPSQDPSFVALARIPPVLGGVIGAPAEDERKRGSERRPHLVVATGSSLRHSNPLPTSRSKGGVEV